MDNGWITNYFSDARIGLFIIPREVQNLTNVYILPRHSGRHLRRIPEKYNKTFDVIWFMKSSIVWWHARIVWWYTTCQPVTRSSQILVRSLWVQANRGPDSRLTTCLYTCPWHVWMLVLWSDTPLYKLRHAVSPASYSCKGFCKLTSLILY